MGFSLMDEPNTVVCPKDVKEGKVCDRYLAPAISEFVTNTLEKTDIGTEMGQRTSEVWRELVSLYRRWGKVKKRTEGDNLRVQTCRSRVADTSQRFTRIVQHKNLPWEKDSIARAAYDPAPIPDCNVQAMVGQHFEVVRNAKLAREIMAPPSAAPRPANAQRIGQCVAYVLLMCC